MGAGASLPHRDGSGGESTAKLPFYRGEGGTGPECCFTQSLRRRAGQLSERPPPPASAPTEDCPSPSKAT